MLRIYASTSSEAALTYYTGDERGDYYTQDLETKGRWNGKAARALGLDGDVDKDEFRRLCFNENPLTGQQLNPGTKAERRVGFDCNFHMPKGLSVYWALTGDDRVIEIMERNAERVMAKMEQYAAVRVRGKDEHGNQRDYDRRTGNLVWGSFTHHTARPVDNGIPDPHLHMHLYCFNTSYDHVENRFKAAQFGYIKENAPMFEADLMAGIAADVRAELGLTPERMGKYFDIREVSVETRKQFSKRTNEIEVEAVRREITDPGQKAELAAKTRGKKYTGSHESCVASWREQADDVALFRVGVDADGQFNPAKRPKMVQQEASYTLDECIDLAIEHCSEKETSFKYGELVAKAVQLASDANVDRSQHHVSDAVEAAIQARDEAFIHTFDNNDLDHRVTTTEILKRELEIIEWAKSSRGVHDPLIEDKDQELLPLDRDKPDIEWAPDQADAIRHIWSSNDGVMLVRGAAGVGKTTLAREAVRGVEDAGTDVLCLAPTTRSRDGMSKVTDNLHTFQKYMKPESVSLRKKNKGNLILLDEAGMIPSKDMLNFLEYAQENKNRVVLMGDTRQLSGVGAGDAMRLLEEYSGLEAAEVTSIQRQRNELYKEMVGYMSEGTEISIDQAFECLDEMTSRRQAHEVSGVPVGEKKEQGGFKIFDREKVYAEVAADYLATLDEGKTAIAVAPTLLECDRINRGIRDGMKMGHRKMLDASKEHRFMTHEVLNWSETDKLDAPRYESGLIIGFHGNLGRFHSGQFGEVAGRDDAGRVMVKNLTTGNTSALSMKSVHQFDVYEKREIDICPGESLIVNRRTKVGGRRDYNKGDMVTVKGFSPEGHIMTDRGYTIPTNKLSVSYGYASTIHSGQGADVDRAFYVHLSDFGNRAMMYVGASRARESVSCYTEDKERLREIVARDARRPLAVEHAMQAVAQGKRKNAVVNPDLGREAAHVENQRIKTSIKKQANQHIGREGLKAVTNKKEQDRGFEHGIGS